jgi:hypothetical protein
MLSHEPKRFIREKRLDADGAAIWDPDHSRLVLVNKETTGSEIVGLPKSVTIWDYRKNTVSSFGLVPIKNKDLQ